MLGLQLQVRARCRPCSTLPSRPAGPPESLATLYVHCKKNLNVDLGTVRMGSPPLPPSLAWIVTVRTVVDIYTHTGLILTHLAYVVDGDGIHAATDQPHYTYIYIHTYTV